MHKVRAQNWQFTGWVRIQFTDLIRTRLISMLLPAKMQLPEVVTGQSEFLSDFSIPQANPTQPVSGNDDAIGGDAAADAAAAAAGVWRELR